MRASLRWSDFRAQGGPWVVAQLVLMAGIAAALLLPQPWPGSVRRPLQIAGAVLVVLGLALAAWAFRALGRSFTAYTTPPADASRVETGPYRLVRHPMYGGGLLFFAGLSLVHSITALGLTLALGVLWRAKSSVEERNLLARFPDYALYRARTPRRFFPLLY
jgi:protein-S-isoprenylcysteine O-methyltransferase Ste14